MTRHHSIESSFFFFFKTQNLTKIGQSLICTGSSTQNTTCPNITQRPHRVYIRVKMATSGSFILAHKKIINYITIILRVVTSLLIKTYIKIKDSNTRFPNTYQSHMSAFFSKAASNEHRLPEHSLYLKEFSLDRVSNA